MIKIILVRHAQTTKNKAGFAQSHGDSDLTPEGLIQTEKIRDFLKRVKIDAVFCSSLGRAMKTATTIAAPHNLPPIPKDGLKEINWGKWSTLPVKKLLKKWEQFYENQKFKGIPPENIRPPKGENSYDHVKRVQCFLDELRNKYRNQIVIIVGHGGTNKVIIGILKGLDPEEFYNIKQDNACINILELDNQFKLVKSKLNLTSHLK